MTRKELNISLMSSHDGSNRVDVGVDVGDGMGRSVGLTCSLDPLLPTEEDARWAAFLNHLVELGLCTEDKKEALRAFPGVSPRVIEARVPQWCFETSRLVSERYRSCFWRGIGAVKVVWEKDRPARAKAYFGTRHMWKPIVVSRGTHVAAADSEQGMIR